MASQRIPVAILGATGTVGQRFIQLLAGAPRFEIAALTGSDRTVGRPYGELVRWTLDGAPPPEVARMVVQPSDAPLDVAIALSGLPTDVAREVEPRWAERLREELAAAVDACYKLIRLTIDEARAEEFRKAAKDLLSRAG